jgi:hypothetical protein
VDSYLEMAERVLRAARRPMTASGILDAAYKAGIVPPHLHGKTQQKTLQARLSEYILTQKRDGVFFRTAPGYFFLTELESDSNIPDQYKDHFSARRRTRDLFRAPALCFKSEFIGQLTECRFDSWRDFLGRATSADAICYIEPGCSLAEYSPAWTFTLVRRKTSALSYRIGRYRDDRDSFAKKRTVGFPSMLSYFDQTFFSDGDLGASECGLRAVLTDLDLSINAFKNGGGIVAPEVSNVLLVSQPEGGQSVLIVMDWKCPDWFEPTMRRLSLNDTRWLDLAVQPNDVNDFEPWSIAALEQLRHEATL